MMQNKSVNIISGKVIRGSQTGKIMGFPTANIRFTKEEAKDLNLETGVFASIVKVAYNVHNSISSVTKSRTGSYVIETHVLDAHTNYYNLEMEIAFLHKVRDVKKFSSIEEICNEIAEDEIKVKKYFKNRKTCENCNKCYKQEEGYSNYTVVSSYIGCFLNKFEEVDSWDFSTSLELHASDIAERCPSYEEGDMWHLDVDGDGDRPSEEQIKNWKRESKIDKLI